MAAVCVSYDLYFFSDHFTYNNRTEYEERMKHLKNLTSPKNSVDKVLADLELCEKHLETDKQFLTGGLINAQRKYSEKTAGIFITRVGKVISGMVKYKYW